MNKFPLSTSPYNSRNNQFLEQRNLSESDDEMYKNYVYTSFTPGYPLQAQELNEIQERWQQQMSLSYQFMTEYFTKAASGESFYVTSSNGVLVINDQALSVEITPLTATVRTITGESNYVSVYDNGMRYWVKLPTLSLTVNMANTDTRYVKLNTQISYINCSSIPQTEGYFFNDNSSGNYIAGTCGAGRVKVEIISLTESSSATDSNLIFRIEKTPNGIKVYNIGTGFEITNSQS